MNFLAHFYLSGDDEDLQQGNFLGDFVKGKSHQQFPPKIARGILLHRSIDTFTDQHPTFLKGKQRFRPQFRLFSGIIMDMVYDHLLAKHWQQYHQVPLSEFSQKVYRGLAKKQSIFPLKAARTFSYMSRYDWLSSYAKVEGLKKALQGLTHRTGYRMPLVESIPIFQEMKADFKQEFDYFLIEIIQFCQAKFGVENIGFPTA